MTVQAITVIEKYTAVHGSLADGTSN